MGTQLVMDDALMYSDSTRILLSYKDIWCNGVHIENHNNNNNEYLFITKNEGHAKQMLEKISVLSTRLYFTYIKPVQRVAYKIIFQNLDVFKTWNDRLGHHMNTYKFLKPLDFVCTHVPREN